MRRLLLLLSALLLACLAGMLAFGGEETQLAAGVCLRDAAFLAAVAAALAAWTSAPYPRAWNQTTWSTMGRALLGAGIVTALVAMALRLFPLVALPNLPPIVWSVGMLAAFTGIVLPPVIVRFAPPAFTWTKDSKGAPVRRPADPAGDPLAALATGRGWWSAFLIVLVLGAGVRIWSVAALPPVCRTGGGYDECAALLALAPESAELPATSALVLPLARALQAVSGSAAESVAGGIAGAFAEPLWALRWASALVALLTLPALALALRPLVSVVGVLLGVTLYALHPLFVGLAADPITETLFWLLLALAGGASALRDGNPRGWALTGLALGLLALTQPAWLAAWLIWLAAAVFVQVRRPRSGTLTSTATSILVPTVTLIAAAAAGATLSTVAWNDVADLAAFSPLLTGFAPLVEQISSAQAAAPAGALWVLALAVVGVGAGVRLRRVGLYLFAAVLATALVATAIVAAMQTGARIDPLNSGALRLLLVFVILFASLGIDQLVRAAQRTWTPLVRPSTWLALGLMLVTALSGWNLYQQSKTAAALDLPIDDRAALATIDFMQSARDDTSLHDATWLLAPALFNHGGVRSATNPERTAGRVLPFAAVADLPFTGEAPGGLVYILPASEQLTLETLQAVYPEGRTLPLASADGAEAIRVWRVDPATLFDSAGLAQFVYAGNGFGSADEAALSLGVAPTAFAWGTAPPRATPFSVEWSGSLLAPTPGDYTFSVAAPAGASFSMTLDDRLLLDTSLGLVTRSERLPAGPQRIEMRFRSGDQPGDLTVTWQPPGEAEAAIPRTALYNPAIPGMGLLGTYSTGSAWDGAIFAQRKDLQIIPDATLELPWGVVWQGYLAAPRAGEYLIGAVTNGALLLDVAGQRLVTRMPEVLGAISPPSEGTIYLGQGWTPLTIRFAPDVGNAHLTPELRLYWQPPGGAPSPLRATFFAPALTSTEGGEITRPLPALPAVDPRLGTEDFALSAESALWMPQVRIPPQNLPLLPFENEARWGVCGAEEGELAAPRGLAWDAAAETLYIADSGNARIAALDLNTGAMRSLPINGLEEPVDVVLTPAGKLVALDTVAPKLVIYDPETETAETVLLREGFYRPRALAVDGGGVLYVADTGGARVAALTPDGGLLTAFGGPESSLGKGQPAAVGVTSRALWAVAAEQGRLWQLNTLGSLTALQPTDTINGPHIATLPPARLVDAQGSAAANAASASSAASPFAESIFVTDPALHRVVWFAGTGQPLGALADEGAFDQPTGVAVIVAGEDMLLMVADTARCELSLWRATTANLAAMLPN